MQAFDIERVASKVVLAWFYLTGPMAAPSWRAGYMRISLYLQVLGGELYISWNRKF
jgi:hypothetical protein